MTSLAPIVSNPEHQQHSAQCVSCGADLSGPYCSQCGEQVLDPHSLTVHHFFSHGVLHELTHLDGKIFRTFRFLLFRPGFLSAEYFAGRRRACINPVRLLLTSVLIFALTAHGSYMSLNIGPLRLSLLPPSPPSEANIEETISKLDVAGVLTRFEHWRGQTVDLSSRFAAGKFNHELKTYGTALSFCNVLLLALFLFALYGRRRPLFLEHLVFSFHLASFVLLFGILPRWLFWLFLKSPHALGFAVLTGAVLVLAAESFYLYRALLRFYRPEAAAKKWWSASAWSIRASVLLVFIANSVFITLTYAAGAAIALMRV